MKLAEIQRQHHELTERMRALKPETERTYTIRGGLLVTCGFDLDGWYAKKGAYFRVSDGISEATPDELRRIAEIKQRWQGWIDGVWDNLLPADEDKP